MRLRRYRFRLYRFKLRYKENTKLSCAFWIRTSLAMFQTAVPPLHYRAILCAALRSHPLPKLRDYLGAANYFCLPEMSLAYSVREPTPSADCMSRNEIHRNPFLASILAANHHFALDRTSYYSIRATGQALTLHPDVYTT